jgi:phosphoribosylglycinamide formyltransferase-1
VKEACSLSNTINLAILISGRGSNMLSIVEAIKNGDLDANAAVVISDKENTKGVEASKKLGITTFVLNIKNYASKREYEEDIIRILKGHDIDLVCLAGYMKVVGNTLLEAFSNRILNIHPSLLPSFRGLNAQKQALEYGVQFSGCTVHYVTSILDGGKIILQEVVPVFDTDDETSLSARILEKEHKLYPKAIQKVIDSSFTKVRS